MQFTKALSLTPFVNDWLLESHQPRILHVFERVCNLINKHREVISVVGPKIGDGPFNLVIKNDILFSERVDANSRVSIQTDRLKLGDLIISMPGVKLWPACPNWWHLHGHREKIVSQLQLQSLRECSLSSSLLSDLSAAFARADVSTSLILAKRLAGLGAGLTPAGDDYILGAVLAIWIIHPYGIAKPLAKEITDTAAPLTTSLSAAFLKSAGRGEAGVLWHEFLDALLSSDPLHTRFVLSKILAVGATSGADALAGFFDTLNSYAENMKVCPS